MKPTLLILAAGIGSRYGSMKQTESFGPSGETITDYSIYDALMSGFGKIVFVISPAMEEEFTTSYVKKFPDSLEVDYALQGVHTIPDGIEIHPDRKKPWGTAHAVLMSAPKIDEPFAVINADDFYGRQAYKQVADFLSSVKEKDMGEFCLAGYRITNTLSEHGTVSRGICETNGEGYLTHIVERTKIKKEGNEIVYLNEDGESFPVNEKSPVSMNLFGFTPKLFPHLEKYFDDFIKANAMNPKAEIFLPIVVQRMIDENTARTKVLDINEKWFGVTYKEDRPMVLNNINKLVENGTYPDNLWKDFTYPDRK
jgi:UTP-glucose-1-phosphate uridylyltransferase